MENSFNHYPVIIYCRAYLFVFLILFIFLWQLAIAFFLRKEKVECNIDSVQLPPTPKKRYNRKKQLKPKVQSSPPLMPPSWPKIISGTEIEEVWGPLEQYQRDLEYLYKRRVLSGLCEVSVLRAFDELPDADRILFPAGADNESKNIESGKDANFHDSNDESWWSKRYTGVSSKDWNRGWRKRGHDVRKSEHDQRLWCNEAFNELPDHNGDLYVEKISPNRLSFQLFPKLPTEIRLMIWRAIFERNVLSLSSEFSEFQILNFTGGTARHNKRDNEYSSLTTKVVDPESEQVWLEDHRAFRLTSTLDGKPRNFIFNRFKDCIQIRSDLLLHTWNNQEDHRADHFSIAAMGLCRNFLHDASKLHVITTDLKAMTNRLRKRPILLEQFKNLDLLLIGCYPQPVLFKRAVFNRRLNNALTAEECKEAFTAYFEDLVKKGICHKVPYVQVKLFLGYRHELEYTRRLKSVQKLFEDSGN